MIGIYVHKINMMYEEYMTCSNSIYIQNNKVAKLSLNFNLNTVYV